jgi:hypothetical protein
MSQIAYRANLTSDNIPLLSAFKGQTVIYGRFDQDYVLDQSQSTLKIQKEKDLPEAYYVHNVMPTGLGYQSVGFNDKIAAKSGTPDFKGCYVLRDVDENKSLFSPSLGKNYIFDSNIGRWQSTGGIVGHESALVTVAYLSGETYIFYQKVGCFKYNKTTTALDAVALTGLVVANINGICSANGFLLAWDDANTIYRSQSATPLNFTPDPALGSGSSIPEDIRGKIIVLLPTTNGFIIYTTQNAVGAVFQQNIRYPFIYKEVSASSGIVSPDHVSWNNNLDDHYVWSKGGLQKVNKSKATPIFPEVTDFITAKIFEDYDTTTDEFVITRLTSQLKIMVNAVGGRYIIISYGVDDTKFTHAVVHDLAYKRFGKLKIDHVAVFEYATPNLSGDLSWEDLGELTWEDLGDATWAQLGTQIPTVEEPKDIVAFVGADGNVKTVNFDLVHEDDSGVAVFGKYKFSRDRLMVLDEIAIENLEQDSNFELLILASIDGKNISQKKVPFLEPSGGQLRTYFTDVVGTNHSIAAKGTFNLVSMELTFHQHGRA